MRHMLFLHCLRLSQQLELFGTHTSLIDCMHTVTGDGMKTSKHHRVDRGALCDIEVKGLQQILVTL
jgi:hypothetical protein